MILAALEKTGGNKTEAARQLGSRAKRYWQTVALVLLAFDSAPADIFPAEAVVPVDIGH